MAVILVLVPILACISCSGDNGDDGPRFLLTSADGLDILSLTQRRDFLSAADGSYFLDPAISPDEKTYAYIRQPPAVRNEAGSVDFGSDLMLVDSDGKNAREALHHAATGEFIRYPIFLKDENAVLVGVRGQDEQAQPDFRIERVDLASQTRTRLIDNAASPALAPDGRTLAYATYDPATTAESIVTRDLVTNETHDLVPAGGPLVLIQNLSWSPDGKVLAFMSSDLSTTSLAQPTGATTFSSPLPGTTTHPTLQDLWLVNADGSNLHKIVDLAESSPSAAWSADSKTIYVMGGSGFFKVDPATGAHEILSEGVNGGQIARIP
jgi:Tol biopolymer transport system component